MILLNQTRWFAFSALLPRSELWDSRLATRRWSRTSKRLRHLSEVALGGFLFFNAGPMTTMCSFFFLSGLSCHRPGEKGGGNRAAEDGLWTLQSPSGNGPGRLHEREEGRCAARILISVCLSSNNESRNYEIFIFMSQNEPSVSITIWDFYPSSHPYPY